MTEESRGMSMLTSDGLFASPCLRFLAGEPLELWVVGLLCLHRWSKGGREARALA